jgi:hypothetical protein
MQGLRVYWKNAAGREVSGGQVGASTGALCTMELPFPYENKDIVGSIDIRSGDWIDGIMIRSRIGDQLGKCGTNSGGVTAHNLGLDEKFLGFEGKAGARIDRIGILKGQVLSEGMLQQ